jgi:hypothetical protein
MSAPAIAPIDRAAINRANSQHSTGPRTEYGKQRSSLNALRHGLTVQSAVLPSEHPAAYEAHHRRFLGEYQSATVTETQLVRELADTFATSKPNAASVSVATSGMLPPSWNSINTKEFPGSPPIMALFFQNTEIPDCVSDPENPGTDDSVPNPNRRSTTDRCFVDRAVCPRVFPAPLG